MNYNNSKIYCIRSDLTDKYYIGSTIQPLSKRLYEHKKHYKKYLDNKYNYVSSFEILQLEKYYIELLELCPCNSKEELLKKEGEYIRKYKNEIVNKNIPCRTEKEWRNENKERLKENQDKISKKWYENHKEELKTKKECECGGIFRYKEINRHLRTKKHSDYVKANNLY
jgi:hypothetical protein